MKFSKTNHEPLPPMIENPVSGFIQNRSSDQTKNDSALAEKLLTQHEAIVRLLQDDDPETVSLVKDQLVQGGEALISELQNLSRYDDSNVSRHAHDVLEEIAASETDEDLLLLCHFFPPEGELEAAWWLISRALGPTPDLAAYEYKLTQWGRRFQVALSGVVSDRERVLALAEFMAEELCFRGNSDNYYCEKNSLLPEVIDRRVGLPLTLTLLYMMVGRRAGMKIDGINLPGHFIARHGEVLFDPFHKGRILTRADCGAILAKQNLKLRSSHFHAAKSRQIVLRILANFLYVYDLHQEVEKHCRVHTWMMALNRGET